MLTWPRRYELHLPDGGKTCGAALAAGANCSVDVAFKPGSRGPKSGSLIASGGGMTAMAALSGSGELPAQLVVRPVEQAFSGTLNVQTASVNFTFTNAGDASSGR